VLRTVFGYSALDYWSSDSIFFLFPRNYDVVDRSSDLLRGSTVMFCLSVADERRKRFETVLDVVRSKLWWVGVG